MQVVLGKRKELAPINTPVQNVSGAASSGAESDSDQPCRQFVAAKTPIGSDKRACVFRKFTSNLYSVSFHFSSEC